ncbi:MAG: hypothetical protein O3A63_18980 [Proteobacteria bacterium]|nr:hypothetical protein [Pseudomonadota bacterium]
MTHNLHTPWIVRIAERGHIAVLPAVWLMFSLGYYWIVYTYSDGRGCCWATDANLWGVIATYSAIPGYILLIATYLWRQTNKLLDDLRLTDAESVKAQVLNPPLWYPLAFCTVAGSVAISQYVDTLRQISVLDNLWLDLSMISSNLITWVLCAWLVSYRISAGIAMMKLGKIYPVDLYNLSEVRPFGRMAILDLLFAMGILALIPLQSLDFEVRWVNYQDALLFVLPLALAMALLPMWGVHQAILEQKLTKTRALQNVVDEADHDDLARMEALLSHRDRIANLSTWPLDTTLASRILLYVILPPLAWSAAALVEALLERFISN